MTDNNDTSNTPERLPQDHTKTVCNVAREAIESGFSVFPLSMGKRPLAKWGKYQTEFATEEDIDDWETNGAPVTDPDTGAVKGHDTTFNLGLACGAISGVVVVDCDNDQAVSYAKEKGLTSPIAVRTRRGMHYYFRHPNNGRRFRNKAGSNPGHDWHNCPGLDFRGDGGYVVAPPSVTIDTDGTIKHRYVWDFATGASFDDMPIWRGTADEMEIAEAFDLAELSLSDVKVGDSATDVREQVQKRVDYIGRKLQGPDQGDGTDNWMIRFCGQMVRRGITGQALWDAIIQFHNEFFEFKGSAGALDRWLKTKMRSALEMDRRNHPEDYDPTTKERLDKSQKEIEKVEVPDFIPIYSTDLKRLLSSLGDTVYHADPLIPSRSIIQVVGYNGHGKSLFMGSLATAMAANKKNFGPYHISKPSKVFYLDFDNPARTVLNRFSSFAATHGDPGNNLALWSPAIIPSDRGGQMNLREKAGLEVLERWLEMIQPDIVVIDTVRNAFGGLDEKSPQDWYHVNRVAKIIRDRYKASVVLVHHRNKPNEMGLGREAGSTAQLTDLDTQIMVTQVYNDKNLAKTKAGLFNEDVGFERKGTYYHPFNYFKDKLAMNHMVHTHRVRTVSEISFGKVREETDLHKTAYIGYVEEIATGKPSMIWSPSLREDAIALAGVGKQPDEIAQELFVPQSEIKKWLGLS